MTTLSTDRLSLGGHPGSSDFGTADSSTFTALGALGGCPPLLGQSPVCGIDGGVWRVSASFVLSPFLHSEASSRTLRPSALPAHGARSFGMRPSTGSASPARSRTCRGVTRIRHQKKHPLRLATPSQHRGARHGRAAQDQARYALLRVCIERGTSDGFGLSAPSPRWKLHGALWSAHARHGSAHCSMQHRNMLEARPEQHRSKVAEASQKRRR